jgi:sugar phosphate isomerase/epimerase
MDKLGSSTFIFNQLDIYGAFQHISWAGFSGVELACSANLPPHIELNTDKSYINDVKATAKKHGLQLYAIDAGEPAFRAQPEDEKLKAMAKLFDVAAKLGIPVVAIRSEGKADDKEITDKLFNYVRKLTKLAESRGITVAMECHGGHSIYNTSMLIKLIDEINSPALGANIDPSNLLRGGDDPAEAVLRLGKRVVHTHLRDCPRTVEVRAVPEQQTPGRGDIDWVKILKNLKKVSYEGALNTHVLGAATYPLSRQMGIAAEGRGYLHKCLQEVE